MAKDRCRTCRALGRVCARIIRFLFAANIEQYFLYSGLTYALLGTMAWVSCPSIHQFLCNISPSEGMYHVGCDNCEDKLLLCRKDACWRMAANLTYQKDSMKPDSLMYKERRATAMDTVCNRLLERESTTSPTAMLSAIIKRRRNSNGREPSDDCVTFHCQVLMNAVLRTPNNSDLALDIRKPEAPCTNTWGLKRPEDARNCTCAHEVAGLSLDLAESFESLCGSMASELTGEKMYAGILTRSKDACYSTNVLSTLTEADATGFKSLQNCTYLTQHSDTAFEWFKRKEAEESLYNTGKTPYRFTVPSRCIIKMCLVFQRTLNSSACDWTTSALLLSMTQADVDRVAAACPSYGFTATSICSAIGPGSTLPNFCAATSTTAASGGASARLLGARKEPRRAEAHGAPPRTTDQPCPPGPSGSPSCGASSGRAPSASHAVLHRSSAAADSRPSPGEHTSRQLQSDPAPSPPPASNDGLEDWTTSPWSRCTCLFQCIEGVRSRSVTCPPGMTCKEPKPADAMPCTCWHCAECYVGQVAQAVAIVYWFQGLCCLLLSVAFYVVCNLNEDDLSEMRFHMKLLGCFCKATPLMVRLAVYVVLVCILVMVFQVIPGLDWSRHCVLNDTLVMVTISVSVCWIVQLVIGIYMKRSRHMPPWLYNSVKEGWMRLAMKPLRAIGP